MKKNKPKKFRRFLLKLIWFGLICTIGIVAWFTLYALIWALNQPSDSEALPTIGTTLLLFTIFIVAYIKFRKSKRILLRWTSKSFVLLAPPMVLCGIGMFVALGLLSSPQNQFNTTDGLSGNQGYVEGLKFSNDKLLADTNEERTKNSKPALTLNEKLNQSALDKCKDMVSSNYWNHNDKEGREPWRFMTATGYAYGKAGENLAFGFSSESAVVNGWMNSQSHKDNLLDGAFTEVGFGTCLSDNFVNMGKQLIVVQHFAVPQTAQQQKQSSPSFTPQQKPYIASVCTKTTIPYTTEYVNDPNMYEGSTYEGGMGWDGYKETCTADSTGYKPADYTSPPYNKKIYVGTKPKPNYSSSQPKDYSRCNQFLGTGAYQACVDAINRQ